MYKVIGLIGALSCSSVLWGIIFYAIFSFSGCSRPACAAEPKAGQIPIYSDTHGTIIWITPIPEQKAILSIIGEAENQGYEGMVAVAYAIQNRGTLKGVYGLRAPRVVKHKYSVVTYNEAKAAWDFVRHNPDDDVTNGATHWENIKAFGCPSWMKKCIETYRFKDHVFFKEIR